MIFLTWQASLTGWRRGQRRLARLLVEEGVEKVGDGPVTRVGGQAARGAAVVGPSPSRGAAHPGRAKHPPLRGFQHTLSTLRIT